MRYVDGIDAFVSATPGAVITIGNFDGVHLGHQALLRECRRLAQDGAQVVAVTFDPHPIEILSPLRAPPRLTTLPERVALLLRAGADQVVVQRVDAAFLERTAPAFLQWIAQRLRPRAIVEGPSFNFGRDRAGSFDTLQQLGPQLGFAAVLVGELHCETLANRPMINSSAIRSAIRTGAVHSAAALLGRPHRLVGRVGFGQQRGAKIGFPTANLEEIPQMLPAEGVFAALAQLADGRHFFAAVNCGPQPTFEQTAARVEAHLIDFSGDLRGQLLGIKLVDRLRGQMKFSGVEQLVAQLRRDVEMTRETLPGITQGVCEDSLSLAP